MSNINTKTQARYFAFRCIELKIRFQINGIGSLTKNKNYFIQKKCIINLLLIEQTQSSCKTIHNPTSKKSSKFTFTRIFKCTSSCQNSKNQNINSINNKPEQNKMNKKYFYLLICFTICLMMPRVLLASKVDTVVTYSASMKKNIKAVVITPNNYSTQHIYNVVYLLNGYSGNYASWVEGMPVIKKLCDEYGVIIVCPDGNYSSWYFDSPIDSSFRYETYVSTELIKYVDSHYHTNPSRTGRAISGLSMGGHGAFYIAFRHQDVFGAVGSMSGGVDIRPFPLKWDISKTLGNYKDHPENWEKNTDINLVYLLTPGSLAITFDCGTEDFFYGVNVALHKKLLERNIPHDFTTRPGGHTQNYWGNSIQYQMLFFSNYFHNEEK